jgi:hypothetical protein
MIAQLGTVDLEDQVVGRLDGSSGEPADAGPRVDAGGDASAAEPRVEADPAAPGR